MFLGSLLIVATTYAPRHERAQYRGSDNKSHPHSLVPNFGLFCGNLGLFCGNVRLFLGNLGLACGNEGSATAIHSKDEGVED